MSSLLLLTSMLVVTGSTCPPTICTEFFLLSATSFFIKKHDKSYYRVRQLFHYNVRQELLQSATAFFLQSTTYVITKCDSFFYYRLRLYFIRKLRKDVMTKCNRYYKVRQLFIKKLWQFYYKVWQVLQNATGTIKCYVYFKVRQNNWPPSPHTISISRAQQSQPFETSQFHKSKESIGNITP